ncbi:hypothetical protein Tco_1567931 [Tanacetum coccineum]
MMDKCKTGLGYNVVPPPNTGDFMPLKSDLVYPSLDDFVDVNTSISESVVEKPIVETNEPKTAKKEHGAPTIEDWVSKSEEEDVPKVKTVKMFNKPSFAKINFVKSTKQVKSPRNTSVDKIGKTHLVLEETREIGTNRSTNNSNIYKRVNTVNDKNVNAARPNALVNTARPKAVLSTVKGNKGNAVKASAC